MSGQKQSQIKPLKYPRGVFFIVSNEFCERFCYYGMRTILALYLTTILRYNDDESTELYHLFTMLCYFFPLFGAIIADSYLGKYKTILCLSVLYVLGNVVLSIASASILHLPQRIMSVLGLLFIAIGTGGIKPCVCPFGGDQFKLPEQERQLQRYFSLFYFSINAGSLFSTSLTPILRADVTCFGENSCFPLAFGVPAVLMVISLVIFLAGSPLYVKKQPEGNIVVTVVKCTTHALRNKFCGSRVTKKNHWLEYADDIYDGKQIKDIQAALNVLYMFLPLPLFWALFDQQGSRWIFQATNMDGRFFGYIIKPDQMQVLNPFLILSFIPLFETCLYPLLYKVGIRRPLQKLALGGILAAVAFVVSAVLELQIEKTYSVMPNVGEGQLRIFNSLKCNAHIQPQLLGINNVRALNAQQLINFPINAVKDHHLEIQTDNSCPVKFQPWKGQLNITEGYSVTYIISQTDRNEIIVRHANEYDDIQKDPNGLAKLRIFYGSPFPMSTSTFKLLEHNTNISHEVEVTTEKLTSMIYVPVGRYDAYLDELIIQSDVSLDPGSISTILLRRNSIQDSSLSLIPMVPSNTVHMLWQLPQIIIITAGEILFSVTGLEFSFTQAPESMKSVLSAAWLLTVSFGNLIVVIISEIKFFKSQAYEFLLFAGLMLLDMGIFIIMAINYKYIEVDNKKDDDTNDEIQNNSEITNF